MNQLFKKAAAFSLSIILFGTSAKAYNLSPISFANFYHIAEEGDLQGLKDVQRRGLNLNSTNQNGDTAVCVAIKRQDYLAYKTLIRAGAKSNPDCTKKIPEYAHKAFLSNYNQKYAAPQTPINWTKSGTALLVGAGVAAGTVALIGVGGGGGGSGGSSSDSGNTQDCSVNKCALGCFENKVCSENEVCDSYNTCGGCESCKASSSCKQNSCNQGCYTNLTCQPGYTCSKRNKCGGCESCAELSECKKNVCAAGCYTNLTCADGYTCSQKNICGGCDRCTLIDPTNPDISNALHCKNYDRDNNLCLACHRYYKLEKGRCVDDIPENCEDYDSVSNKCTSCLEGYKISDDGRVCLVEQEDLECNATNYPLTTIPDKNTSYYDSCTDNNKTKRYRISGCKEGYQINSTKTACLSSGGSTGEETLTCNTTNYPLTRCPDNANECSSCTPTGSSTYIYRLKSCKTGFSISSDGKSCTKDHSGGGNTDPTCDETNFPATECPLFATCKKCSTGSSIRYKILQCSGSDVVSLDGKDCVDNSTICTAENFPLSKCPDNSDCQSCIDGDTRRTRIISCNIGYSLNSDKTACWQQCNKSEYKLSYCPFNAKCTSCTPNGDTTQTSYKIITCDTGLKVNEDGTDCERIDYEECTAEAYPLTSCPGHGSCTSCYGYLDDNDGPRYKLDRCFTGYTMTENKDNCVQTPEDHLCNDTNYPLSYCPYGANCNSCMQGDNPKYQIYSCIMDYSLSADGLYCIHNESGTCTAESYPFTACPANMNCDSCRDSTNIMRYKTFACVSGYKLSEDLKSCVADETQNCDTKIYPFTSCPDGAYCNYCQDSHGTRSNIAKCWFDYTLSDDGLSCSYTGSGKCDEANFPIDWQSGCPTGAVCAECTGDEGIRYRISKCYDGWTLEPSGMYCVTAYYEECSNTNYPLASCPKYAKCAGCSNQGTTLYKIESCEDIATISPDGLSCEYKGCGSDYKHSQCPANATCDYCKDDSGEHYKFKSCIGGYERDGLNETCVVSELEPMNNDIANDSQLSINRGNTTEYISKNKITYAVGFTNYGKDEKANVYNAKTTDASITVKKADELNKNGERVVAFGSPYPVEVINAYDGHTGTITVTTETLEDSNHYYGLLTNNNAYNSYNANGTIKLTILADWANIIGMLAFSDSNGTMYNAFGGKGNIHIETNSERYNILNEVFIASIGMGGYNVINAFNGGEGNIYIKSSGTSYGIASNSRGSNSYDNLGLVVNAYSTNGSKTIGTITIDSTDPHNVYEWKVGYGIGLEGGSVMYNADGAGAEGHIIINTSKSAVGIDGRESYYKNIANGANGGTGYIKIKNTESTYSYLQNHWIGGTLKGMNNGYNAINGGTGYIDIEIDDTPPEDGIQNRAQAIGISGSGGNGFSDGSIGHITITDKGDNNTTGLYSTGEGLHNYYGSDIHITSAAGKNSTVMGINALKAATNYGEIDIKLSNKASAYGFYIGAGNNDAINETTGTITIKREYTDNNSSDEVSSNTYGMTNDAVNNTSAFFINKGTINLIGPSNPAANQKDYLYGMYLNIASASIATENIPKMLNYGTIKTSGGYQRYGMYNGLLNAYNLSFNYGTVYGDMVNVHNAVGGKVYGKMEIREYLHGVLDNNPKLPSGTTIGVIYNGDAEHIATSADDQDKGYIEYTMTKDDDYAVYVNSSFSDKSTAFYNYGVINVYNNTENGIALYINSQYSRNYGYAKITNKKDGASIIGMHSNSTYEKYLYNNGILELVADNTNNLKMIGMTADSIYTIENLGHIKIDMGTSTNSTAYGIYLDKERGFIGTKEGSDITITSTNNGTAYGIYADNAKIKNHGNITLTGVNPDTSYGIYAVNGSEVYNSGTITINGEAYSDNAASGHFIYIDESSEFTTDGDVYFPESFDTAALGGGKFVLGKNGKITAPEIKGEITADANITSGGFDKTYSSENAVSGKNDEVKLNSGSALFDAVLKNNDIVMTMKDFDKVVDDKSLAAYLQHNYNAKRNDGLFNQLKTYDTAQNLNSALNQNLGFSLLPNFAQENMNVFRSLSNLVTDTMFSQDLTNERMMVGYDYLGQDRSSKGRVTGYENTANSSYFLADTKLNNRQRFGLGVALTRFNSDYDDDSTRKATFAQALASYMHNFGNHWQYAGVARLGYADGDYKRKAGSTRIEGDTSDILYGLNNELRYNYDFGFMTLEPQVELNAYGYYQRKIKEDDAKTDALLVDGTNNLSVEAGAGLYASKETVYGENGRIKARLGGSYYRELSQPYHSMHARVRDTDGYYLIESTDIFDRNRMVVRADITFSWKALDFYLRGSQFMEDKHTTVINAGVKYNF